MDGIEQYRTCCLIPNMLLTDDKYAGLPLTAKVLYALLLSRVSVDDCSVWLMEQDVEYSREELKNRIVCEICVQFIAETDGNKSGYDTD